MSFSDMLPIWDAVRVHHSRHGTLANIAYIELGDEQWAIMATRRHTEDPVVEIAQRAGPVIRIPCRRVESPDYIGIVKE